MKAILLPTDFSPPSEKAMQLAIEIAKKSDAKIIATHAFYVPVLDINVPPQVLDEMYQEEKKDSNEKLQKVCQQISGNRSLSGKIIESEYIAEQNLPASEISKLYRKKNPDLIVIGTEGKDHLFGFLGSTTMDVLESVECPVLVVRADSKITNFKNIHVALEDIKEDIPSLKQLIPFAKTYHAEVTIVNVEKYARNEEEQKETREKREEAESFVQAVREQLNYPNIKIHSILSDDASEGLDSFLKAGSTDLLALKKQKRNWLENLFHKSVIKHLIKESSIPLLIIHN